MVHFDDIIEHVLKFEGGYVNDPVDPGGETKYGISKRAHPEVDIRSLTKKGAAHIYLETYWLGPRINQLPAHLRFAVFDAAVNVGPGRAIRWLQKLAGVKADGIIGPITLAAAENVSIDAYSAAREIYYHGLVREKPPLRKFLRGWLRRTEKVLVWTKAYLAKQALAEAAAQPSDTTTENAATDGGAGAGSD